MHNSEVLKCDKSNIEFLKISKGSKKAIFVLHGYGASMNDLYGLESVIHTDEDFDWIFPNGPLKVDLGMHVEGRAWFPVDMEELQRAMMSGTTRSYEDRTPVEFEEVLPVVEQFIKNQSSDYDEIILAGFSQGAMITSHITALGMDKLKGFILMSGTLLSRDMLIENLEKQKPVPFIQTHGKNDPVLSFDSAMKLFELLKLCRFSGEFIPFDGGHEVAPSAISKISGFINKL